MKGLWHKIRHEWQHPEEREFIFPAILGLMVILWFFTPILREQFHPAPNAKTLPSFLSQTIEASILLTLVFILMAAIWVYAPAKRLTRLSFFLFLITAGLNLVNLLLLPGYGKAELAYLPVIPLLFIACFVLMRYLIHAQTVSVGTLSGAVLCYLLLPMVFTHLFLFAWIIDPDVLRGIMVQQEGGGAMSAWDHAVQSDVMSQLHYFSMTTFTTLGYGDITPAKAITRSLATGEAAFGQIYIGIIIAKLVSLYMRQGVVTQSDREE